MVKSDIATVVSTQDPVSEQMPLWGERDRGLPIPFARSALFSVGGKSERKMLSRHTIASQPLFKLVYTGEELRTDDEDLLIQLFHMARGSAVHPSEGVALQFSGHAMLKELGWKVSKEGYDRLKNSLTRMQNGSLISTRTKGRRRITYAGQVLRKFVVDETAVRQQWFVWLEPEILKLFDPDFATIGWADRARLNRPLSKWLHSFIKSFRFAPDEVFVAPEDMIHRLSGSGVAAMTKFRQLLKAALTELASNKVIADWKVSDGYVYVAWREGQDINRAGLAAALAFQRQQSEVEGPTLEIVTNE